MNPLSTHRIDPLRVYVWLLCTLVFAGESYVLLTTDKYWPQGMDEMAFCATLLTLTWRPLSAPRLVGMIGSFGFLFGSLYTMFFSRLDPHFGTKAERLGGLLALMLACAIGAWWAARRLRQAARSEALRA